MSINRCWLASRSAPWSKYRCDVVSRVTQARQTLFQLALLLKVHRTDTKCVFNCLREFTGQTVRATKPAKLEFIVLGVRHEQSKTVY